MATVRELQASFIAKAAGMKSTIQGIKKDINDLAKQTKKSSDGMDKNFNKGTSNIANHLQKMSVGAQKSFEGIGKSIQSTSVKLEDWSRDIKSFGKTTSKFLSPLTAFYATAAITGGKRMAANEQLDILMKNTFRTEKAYDAAWESVNKLTKGTAFMNSDVGGWLSQLVQSNIELDKSESIMKSLLDFSVGSGQLGIEGEMHNIVMNAIRSGGWDQTTLNMLAMRGMNLAGHVANVMNVPVEQAQEMLKDGTISMEESLDYLISYVQEGSKGVGGEFGSMADSAQRGGETFTGALINMGAAVAQLGEKMWEGGAWDSLKEAMNNIYDFIQELQPALEPTAKIISDILAMMVDWIQKLMTAFINLRPKTQALIAGLSVIGAVLGPAIYMFGSFVGVVSKALKPLGFLFTGLGKLAGIVGKVAGAFGKGGLQGVITAVGNKLPWLARIFTVLTGPIGIVIGIITALVTSFIAAYQKSEPLRDALAKTGDLFKSIYNNIKNALPWFDNFKVSADGLKKSFDWLLTGLKSVGNFLAKTWGAILTLAVNKFNLFLRVFDVATENLGTLVSAWKKLFSGDFKGAFEDFGEFIKNVFTEIVDILGEMIAPVKDKALEIGRIIVVSIVDWVKSLPGKMKDKLLEKTDGLAEWSGTVVEKIKSGLTKKSVDIVNWAKDLPEKIKKELFKRANIFGDWLKDQHKENKEFYSALPQQIGGWLSDKKESIVNGLKSWGTGFATFFTDTKDKVISKAKELGTNFGKSIKNQKDKIIEGFKTWGSNIGGWFVETKGNVIEGAKNLATNFGKTIINAKDRVVTAFNSWLKTIKNWFKGIGKKANTREAGKEIIDEVKEGAEEKKDDLMGRMGGIIIDGLKNLILIAGVIALSVGRELITRVSSGMKGAKNLVTKAASDLWEKTKSIFSKKTTEIVEGFQKSFVGRIITNIIKFASNFRKNISDLWQKVLNKFKEKINEIYNNLKKSFVGRIITNIVSFSKNFRDNISKMWSLVKNMFTKRINEIRNSIANSFVGRIISSITILKTRFVNIAKDMWAGVRKQFNNIVSGAKGLPKRIGDGIRSARDKATSGMKSVGNSIIRWAGKPFNKVVDGVNWITGKLGIKSKISTWNYPQYAKGTKGSGHPGGPAVVGDGPGRELVQLPDGNTFVSPDTDTLVDLPKGTHVVPNKQTEKILKSDVPHYARGTIGKIGNFLGKTAKKTKDVASDVWEYASNPGKLVSKIMDGISIIKDKAQIPTKIVSAGFNYLKNKPLEFIKKKFSESGGGGKPAFGWPVTSPFGYRTHPITGARKLHGGTDFGAPAGSPIPSTTGGTVSYAGGGWNGGFGNLVKVRQGMMEYFYAHMSKIIARVGQAVKKGDILGLVGSTGASTGPHLHYEARRNGVRMDPMKLKGYADGGIINSKQLAWIAEGGWAESIISHDPSKRVRQQRIWQETGDRLGFTDDKYSKKMLAELERIAKAVEEGHGHDIIVNDRILGEAVEPHVTHDQNRRKRRKRRASS